MKKLYLIICMCWLSAIAYSQTTTRATGDVNGDGKVDASDVSYLVNQILNEKYEYVTLFDGYKENGHEYVDLGIGVKWATTNIGADNPQDYGLYFAWGATTGYTSDTSDGHQFTWETTPFNGGESTASKFEWQAAKSTAIGADNNLLPANDAAHVNWGGNWRMPTDAEMTNLRENCYWEWTSSYNNSEVKGYIVYKVKSDSDKGVVKPKGGTTTTVGSYSINDVHIFLPAAGNRLYIYHNNAGKNGIYNGFYWSSTFDKANDLDFAYGLSFYPDEGKYVYRLNDYRRDGLCIRPVCP